jgi:hypothetical protein
LLANHHNNHEDLFLANFFKKQKNKKNAAKTRAKMLPRKHGAKESQRRQRLAGHMPRRLLATYQMMS